VKILPAHRSLGGGGERSQSDPLVISAPLKHRRVSGTRGDCSIRYLSGETGIRFLISCVPDSFLILIGFGFVRRDDLESQSDERTNLLPSLSLNIA
jgi:hypothetical protein